MWFSWDKNLDRDDSDLTPRERRALHAENSGNAKQTAKVVAERARQAEAKALGKWFKL